MAQIPRVGPGSTQLRTESVIPTQSATAEQTYTDSLGKGLQTIGGAIEKVADEQYQKLDEARNYTEIAQAEADDAKFQAEELLRAENATDAMGRPYQGNVKEYGYEDRAKAREERLNGYFSNKETASKFLAYRQRSIAQTGISLQKKFYGNLLEANKNAVIARSELAPIKDMPSVLEEGIKAGSINRTDADLVYAKNLAVKDPAKYMADYNQGKFNSIGEKASILNISAKQSLFTSELYAPDADLDAFYNKWIKENYGSYNALEMEKLTDFYRAEKAEMQKNTNDELVGMYNRKELTKEIIKQKESTGRLSSTQAKSLYELSKTTPSLISNGIVRSQLITQFAKAKEIGGWWKNKEEKERRFNELAKFQVDIVNAINEKQITKEDAEKLFFSISSPEKDLNKQLANYDLYNKEIVRMESFVKTYPSLSAQNNLRRDMQEAFFAKIESGTKPSGALDEVVQEHLNNDRIKAIDMVVSNPAFKVYNKNILDTIAKEKKITFDVLKKSIAKKDGITTEELEKRIK